MRKESAALPGSKGENMKKNKKIILKKKVHKKNEKKNKK